MERKTIHMATAKTQASTSPEELSRQIAELRNEVERLKASVAEGVVEQTLEQIKAAADDVRRGTSGGLTTLRQEVRTHPLPSLAVAFALGVVLGAVTSR